VIVKSNFAQTLNDSIDWNNAVDAEFKKEQQRCKKKSDEMASLIAMPYPPDSFKGGDDDDKIAA
jgi:hypothetical protein